jgi:hypothetical protein
MTSFFSSSILINNSIGSPPNFILDKRILSWGRGYQEIGDLAQIFFFRIQSRWSIYFISIVDRIYIAKHEIVTDWFKI